MSKTTTIQVTVETKKLLDETRLVPGETYDSIIRRALETLKEK